MVYVIPHYLQIFPVKMPLFALCIKIKFINNAAIA